MTRTHLLRIPRVSLLLGWLVLPGNAAWALSPASAVLYHVLLDTDGDPATGCTVVGPAGTSFPGADQRLTITATYGAGGGTVSGITRARCVGGTFGEDEFVSAGGWPVGPNNGVSGSDLVEGFSPLASLGHGRQLTLGVLTVAGGRSDALFTADGQPDGLPMRLVLDSAVGVPLLGRWALAALTLLLVGAGIAVLQRQRARRRTLALLATFGAAATAAWAATITMDGRAEDWAGIDPLGTQAVGNVPGVSIAAFFATADPANLYVRIDVAPQRQPEPTATATAAPTRTRTATPTSTATRTPTVTATAVWSPTPTPTAGSRAWKVSNIVIPDAGTDLVDVQFIGAEGWIIGNPPFSNGRLYKVLDAGGSPTVTAFDIPGPPPEPAQPEWCNALFVRDNTHVYAVTNQGSLLFYDGSTWTRTVPLTASLRSIHFPRTGNGYCCGTDSYLGVIDTASPPGVSPFPGALPAVGVDFALVHAVSATGIWLAYTNSLYYYDGVVWQNRRGGGVSTVRALHFLDEDTGAAVDSGSKIFRFTGSGPQWWQEQGLPSGLGTATLTDVFLASGTEGWVVGANADGHALVLHTTTGGTTWEVQYSSAVLPQLNAVHMIDATKGYAVGNANTVLVYE